MHRIDTISKRSIRDLGEALLRSSDQPHTLVAPPAGKNRAYMQKPIVEMTSALANEFEDLQISLRVGIDTTELTKVGLSPEDATKFPGYLSYKEQLDGVRRVAPYPTIQPETNSVLECLAAIHEAREQPSLQSLLLPRDMETICTRIRVGLQPYLNRVDQNTLRQLLLVKVPTDPHAASSVRSVSEIVSVAATKAFALGGNTVLQNYLEKKGPLKRMIYGLHQLKLKILPKSGGHKVADS